LSDPDEPAIVVRDLTGALKGWIEVGLPEAARLHKAAKAAEYVAVYPTKDPETWLSRLGGERIHQVERIAVRVIEATLMAALVQRLERRMEFDLSMSDGVIYLSMGEETLTGGVQQLGLAR
jgi:uncharacterized protein YaeQ